jgi:hypothetical protein
MQPLQCKKGPLILHIGQKPNHGSSPINHSQAYRLLNLFHQLVNLPDFLSFPLRLSWLKQTEQAKKEYKENPEDCLEVQLLCMIPRWQSCDLVSSRGMSFCNGSCLFLSRWCCGMRNGTHRNWHDMTRHDSAGRVSNIRKSFEWSSYDSVKWRFQCEQRTSYNMPISM